MIPQEIIKAARAEYQCRGRVRGRDERKPLVFDGEVVGFFTPHVDGRGWNRMGPVFVLPEYRRKGVCVALYRREGATKDLHIFVAGDNPAGKQAAEKAGFVFLHGGAAGGCWMLRRKG